MRASDRLRAGVRAGFAPRLGRFPSPSLADLLADFDLIQIQRGAVDLTSPAVRAASTAVLSIRLHCFPNLYYFQGVNHAGRKIRVCIPVVHLTATRERVKDGNGAILLYI